MINRSFQNSLQGNNLQNILQGKKMALGDGSSEEEILLNTRDADNDKQSDENNNDRQKSQKDSSTRMA